MSPRAPGPGLLARLRDARGRGALAVETGRALAVGLLVYCVLFNLSVVRGSSMAPGIHDGDRILVEPWSYVVSEVERGDVVVLRYPLDPSVDYIKRIVGLPGEQVFVCNGLVWVDGQPLEEPYVRDACVESPMLVDVRPGTFFVMGDNRPRSSDSREFGLVPAELVRGRVELRLWPPHRIGLVR